MIFGGILSLPDKNPKRTSFMRYQANKNKKNVGLLEWTTLNNISGFLVGAAIKGEDPRFLIHGGIDFRITIERIRDALRHKQSVKGVSSITQQTARNLFLVPTRTLRRKLLEAVYGILMEFVLSKQRIVEIYLNIIEFGDGIWGCTSAAHYYFRKQPKDLDLFESLFLISLLPSPRSELSGKNLQRAWISQMQILHVMYLSELVTLREFTNALEKAKGVHQLLASGAGLHTALAYSPATVVMPSLPIINQDARCSCTLQTLFNTKCGLHKEIERRRLLENRFDRIVLQKAIVTNDYSLLSDSSVEATNLPLAGGV